MLVKRFLLHATVNEKSRQIFGLILNRNTMLLNIYDINCYENEKSEYSNIVANDITAPVCRYLYAA